MSKMQYAIKIDNLSFTIATDETEKIFLESVRMVNDIIEKLHVSGLKDPRNRALMAALQLATQVVLAQEHNSYYKEQLEKIQLWAMNQSKLLTEIEI